MRVLPILLVASLLPLVAAQAHEHGDAGPISIATDLNDAGLALVGHPVHFAIIAFGDDDEPDFHSDLPVRVWNNEAIIFDAGATAGHDYDGINAFDISFMAIGTWRVEALMDGEVVAHRQGTVIPANGAASIDASITNDNGILVDYAIMQDGKQVPHVDGLIEAFMDDRLIFRTHTHSHEARQVARFVPDTAGNVMVRLTGYVAFPTDNGPRFEPVVYEQTVQFTAPLGIPSAPATTPPPQATNAIVRGVPGEYHLIGTFDPFTQVGSDTIQHLSTMVVDASGLPVQHVDFAATLRGPNGLVFSSENLHEYDGIFEIAVKQSRLGLYEMVISATYGDWSDEITMPYAVVPAGAGAKAGDQLFSVAADLSAKQASQIQITGADGQGMPFAHGEIEVNLRTPAGLPLLLAKIHTHGTGTFEFDYAAPIEGALSMSLTPFPLEAAAITGYYGDAAGEPLASSLDVAPGTPRSLDAQLDGKESSAATPSLVMLALTSLAMLARRRR